MKNWHVSKPVQATLHLLWCPVVAKSVEGGKQSSHILIIRIIDHTLRCRQSSPMGALSVASGGWGQASPKAVAFWITLGDKVFGSGALNLRLPIGGLANGIPNHFSVLAEVDTPRKIPDVVRILRLGAAPGAATAACAWQSTMKDRKIWLFKICISRKLTRGARCLCSLCF